VKSIPHGIRIDSLWELLVFHKLDDKLSLPVAKDKVRADRWLMPDERTEKVRQTLAEVEQLVADARQYISIEKDYDAGLKKCNQAIELMPNYAPAYRLKALSFVNRYGYSQQPLSRATALEFLAASLNSAVKYTELAPSDPEGVTLVCLAIVNQGVVTRDYAQHQKALDILNKLLSAENIDRKAQARAHSTRGLAHTGLGDNQSALRDHNEAVRLGPDLVSIWDNRGNFWRSQGRRDLAEADYAKAREIRAAAKK
jgi:tetratricopeptide (TPR) repeat protein